LRLCHAVREQRANDEKVCGEPNGEKNNDEKEA